MTFRILITGSRYFADYILMAETLHRITLQAAKERRISVDDLDVVLVHGDARGADKMAGGFAKSVGWKVESYPADWKRNGRGAGPIRNQLMVDKGANICVAFPLSESIGTYDCITRAQAAGLRVVVVDSPDHLV